jgi:predicted nucleotidyltransferase
MIPPASVLCDRGTAMKGALTAEQVGIAVRVILAALPQTQAIYLYGSAASGALDTTGAHSDVDIAVILPHGQAKAVGSLAMSETRFQLEEVLERPVDLVNARTVPIVLQKEIIGGGSCVFALDSSLVEEYEMLVLSLYGKLNEERRGILEDFFATGSAYPV